MLNQINTSEPVRVITCTVSDDLAPVGYVDVLPLVNLVSGDGEGYQQGKLYHLPYLRIQGGDNALVIDPQPGDIGLAVYAMRDTEGVKETREASPTNPTTARAMSKSDGFYIGGFLNKIPKRWIHIRNAGIDVEAVDDLHTHGKITVMDAEDGWTVNAAAGVTINASSGVTINAARGGVRIKGDTYIEGGLTWTGEGEGMGRAKFRVGLDVLSGGMTNVGGITNSGGYANSGGVTQSNGVTVERHTHGGVMGGGDRTDQPAG